MVFYAFFINLKTSIVIIDNYKSTLKNNLGISLKIKILEKKCKKNVKSKVCYLIFALSIFLNKHKMQKTFKQI